MLDKSDIRSYYRSTRARSNLDCEKKKESKKDTARQHIVNKTDPKFIQRREDPHRIKGQYGVFASEFITKGSFVCEYAGDLIDRREAERRDIIYEVKNKGSYMFYFNFNNKCYCLDATEPSKRIGRLINHSRKRPNCKMELFIQGKIPHLILTAIQDIKAGDEILYDYGERNKDVIDANPWIEDS